MKTTLLQFLKTAEERNYTLKNLSGFIEKYNILNVQVELPEVQGVFKTMDEFPRYEVDIEQVKSAAKIKNDMLDQSSKGILAKGF